MTVERMCAVCRKRYEKSKLLRIVRFKTGEIKIDTDGKLQGRGMYICRDKECLMVAEKRRVIERAFSRRVEPDIYRDLIEKSGNDE